MPRSMERLPQAARAELMQCFQAGLGTHQTRLRLALRGVMLAERTVSRYLTKLRAEQRRIAGLEAIGRGLGSVQIGATGAAEILRTGVPDWRRKQAGVLQDLFQQFLAHPSGDLYCGLAVGMHAFLLSAALSEALERPDA